MWENYYSLLILIIERKIWIISLINNDCFKKVVPTDPCNHCGWLWAYIDGVLQRDSKWASDSKRSLKTTPASSDAKEGRGLKNILLHHHAEQFGLNLRAVSKECQVAASFSNKSSHAHCNVKSEGGRGGMHVFESKNTKRSFEANPLLWLNISARQSVIQSHTHDLCPFAGGALWRGPHF